MSDSCTLPAAHCVVMLGGPDCIRIDKNRTRHHNIEAASLLWGNNHGTHCIWLRVIEVCVLAQQQLLGEALLQHCCGQLGVCMCMHACHCFSKLVDLPHSLMNPVSCCAPSPMLMGCVCQPGLHML